MGSQTQRHSRLRDGKPALRGRGARPFVPAPEAEPRSKPAKRSSGGSPAWTSVSRPWDSRRPGSSRCPSTTQPRIGSGAAAPCRAWRTGLRQPWREKTPLGTGEVETPGGAYRSLGGHRPVNSRWSACSWASRPTELQFPSADSLDSLLEGGGGCSPVY